MPPGRCLVLLNTTAEAFWITSWPFAAYVKHAWPGAWVCSAFRNESALLSSELISQAVAATRWYYGEPPDLGMITFVDPAKVRKKRDFGRCYRKAGFREVGATKGGLVALQLLPAEMPEALKPLGAASPWTAAEERKKMATRTPARPRKTKTPVDAAPPEIEQAKPLSKNGKILLIDMDDLGDTPIEPTLDLGGLLPPEVAPPTVEAPMVPAASYQPFTRVQSNIKGGVDVPLGPCTAIVGPNRAAKTAVLDAFLLAATGQHPAFPAGSQAGSALMRLVPDGAGVLEARLVGPSGLMEFTVEGSRASAKTPRHDRQGVLANLSPEDIKRLVPTIALGDLLNLDTKKAREEIFARFGDVKELPEPPGPLNAEQKTLWAEAVQQVRAALPGADVAEVLSEIGATLRKWKMAWGRDIKSKESEIAQLRADLNNQVPPSAEDLAAAEQRLASALQTGQALTHFRRRDALLREIEAFKVEIATLPEVPPEAPVGPIVEESTPDLAPLRQAISALGGQVKATEDLIREDDALITVLQRVAAKSKELGGCAVCGTPGAENADGVLQTLKIVSDRRTARSLELGRLRNEVQAHTSKLNAAEAHVITARQQRDTAVQNERSRIQALWDRAAKTRDRLAATKAEIASVLTALGHDPQAPTPIDGQEAGAREALTTLRALEARYKTVSEGRVRIKEMEIAQGNCKVLEVQAQEVLRDLLEQVKLSTERAVNRYMPKGFAARLVLDEEGKSVCRWEVVGRDKRSHGRGAASGSEWASLYLAIAQAWTDGAPMRLLAVDDDVLGRFDPAGVNAFLTKIADCVQAGLITQAIVAWTRENEIPVGWQIVRRG